MSLHDTTRSDEAQAELGRRAHEMQPHPGSFPPAPDPQAALDAARHREGLARMLAPAEEARPNDAIRLVRLVSTCWYLWTVRP
jgi:hypothetical protein